MRNSSNPTSDKRTLVGVLPKVTGLDYVVWLHRRRGDRLPFVEATPSTQYDRATSLIFYLEPMVIGPSYGDAARNYQTVEFINDNLVTIMDFWENVIDDPKMVIEAIRKPKFHR